MMSKKQIKIKAESVELSLSDYKRSIPDDVLLRAKQLYMGFESVSEIARILEINRTTLQYYVRKDWKDERNLLSSEFISSITSSRAAELASIQGSSIKILKRSLMHIANRSEPPSTKEGLDAMKILEGMDKLAKANPSEYTAFEGNMDDEVLDLEVVDPFAALEEGEIDENQDDKTEE